MSSVVAIKIKSGQKFDLFALEEGNGKCDLLDFFSALNDSNGKEFAKLVRLLDWTADSGILHNEEKFKRLTDDIYEFKTHGGVRVLCFFDGRRIIVLTNGFMKKKEYGSEIQHGENLRAKYLNAKSNDCISYREEKI